MTRLRLCLAATVFFASCATVPQDDAGRVAREFLAAYNKGSVEALTDFFRRYSSGEARDRAGWRARWVHANVWQPIRRFAVQSTERLSDREIAFVGRSVVTDAWYRFTIEVEPDASGVSFGFEHADRPPAENGRISVTTALRDLNTYVDRLCASDIFSGNVLVVRDETPLLSRSCGFADREASRLNTMATQFNIGSATKMFTSAGVMRLVADGKLTVGDKVGAHLASFGNEPVRESVTVRQLLTHTSGLGTFSTPEYRVRKRDVRTVGDLLPYFEKQPLEFTPGARYSYSNAGYALLGRIIEAAAKTDYYEFIASAVFAPAGMSHTGWPTADADLPARAVGYTFARDDGDHGTSRIRNDFVHAMRGSPAGSSYSTAGDLVRFARALRAAAILPGPLTEELLTPRVTIDETNSYGFGFHTRMTRAGRVTGHNGHHFGINAQFDMYLDRGWTVVVLSNYDPPSATLVASKIQEVLERTDQGQ